MLALFHRMLRPQGHLLLMELDADTGTSEPHALSFVTWRELASGFTNTRELASVRSRFLRRIYSAASVRA